MRNPLNKKALEKDTLSGCNNIFNELFAKSLEKM